MHKTNYTCIIQEMISVEAQTLKLEKALKTTCNKNTITHAISSALSYN
jgi:hypothetical protein